MKHNYNVGIGFLKFVMAGVICQMHFGCALPGQRLAVPAFMFCSFLFTGFEFPLAKRLIRILLPFWFWSVVGVIFLHFVCGFRVTPYLIVSQFLLGHAYSLATWFLASMALCSIAVFLIARFRARVWISLAVIVALLVFQHTGLNYRCFGWMPNEFSYPLGRLAEMLTFALSGCVVSTALLADAMRLRTRILIAVVAVLVFVCSIAGNYLFPIKCPGFVYEGIYIYLGAVSVSLLFYEIGAFIPTCRQWLARIFNTSACIYFIHCMVGHGLGRERIFLNGLIVFAICFLLALPLQRIRLLKRVVN